MLKILIKLYCAVLYLYIYMFDSTLKPLSVCCVCFIMNVWLLQSFHFGYARSAHGGNINRWINKFNGTLVYHRVYPSLLLLNIAKCYNCDTAILDGVFLFYAIMLPSFFLFNWSNIVVGIVSLQSSHIHLASRFEQMYLSLSSLLHRQMHCATKSSVLE